MLGGSRIGARYVSGWRGQPGERACGGNLGAVAPWSQNSRPTYHWTCPGDIWAFTKERIISAPSTAETIEVSILDDKDRPYYEQKLAA